MIPPQQTDYYDDEWKASYGSIAWRKRQGSYTLAQQLSVLRSADIPVPRFGLVSQIAHALGKEKSELALLSVDLMVELLSGETRVMPLSLALDQAPDHWAYVMPHHYDDALAGHRIHYIGVGNRAYHLHSVNKQLLTDYDHCYSNNRRMTLTELQSWPAEAAIAALYRPLHLLFPVFAIEIALVNNGPGGVVTSLTTNPIMRQYKLDRIVDPKDMASQIYSAMRRIRNPAFGTRTNATH